MRSLLLRVAATALIVVSVFLVFIGASLFDEAGEQTTSVIALAGGLVVLATGVMLWYRGEGR